ncbi:NAD-dependent epimerase/dehydratase family protein [Erythrobacter sp.]|uniref:NAD-dependent epimerase/dehydratase family protein n=1 Tax=Erythrobacter sp. TaxID=1042 RepID=UPI0025D02CA5|nr:NAD-dependent epimerase/dehydratase family protein [Erythrobacter sp.]
MSEVGQGAKPLILITGADGNIGHSLARALEADYRIVGLDRSDDQEGGPTILKIDITSRQSITRALDWVGREHGHDIAAVIHLVAFFDFSGEPNPLYDQVNLEGTRNLIAALEGFRVERFIYASTMLVHAPTDPGGTIDETAPFDPQWEYPQSKKKVEDLIRSEAQMPYAILRLAGVYDAQSAVPTLSHQIARIYERNFQSRFYAGPLDAGQSMLHREDMIDAVRRTVQRRATLPPDAQILIGEPEAVGYGTLQDTIGELIHGTDDWATLRLPAPVAQLGAAAQNAAEPLIPDAIDHGEKPFIKPFMIAMADDHYALDIGRAERWLGWRPQHRLADELPAMVANLQRDPAAWYDRNGITPPDWLREKAHGGATATEQLRREVEARRIEQHRATRWTHFVNIGLACWLITQPPMIGIENGFYAALEVLAGLALLVTATASLSWQIGIARWASAGLGLIIMALPVLFVTPNAAAYLSDTLVGGIVFGMAVCAPPEIGPSVLARRRSPEIPPGWSFNPSSWTQRLPVIALAIVGLLFSRYLAAYQMEHIDSVWEPFFDGSRADPQNGTEEIITSSVSEAWPVPDAAVGAFVYMVEILTGIVGSRARWRTMPWLVLAFGLLIVPLGIVSVGFIIIQPIVIGTWSTLALIGATAMLVQIPYSIDELAASMSFLRRRVKAGRSFLRVLLFGDTDDVSPPEGRRLTKVEHEFDRGPGIVLKEMWTGAVNLPWTLWLAGIIALSFLFTRLTLGADGGMADADHLLGALVLTVLAVAAAEVCRAVRFLLVPLGLALAGAPLLFGGDGLHIAVSIVGGLAIAVLAFPRGKITESYGSLDRIIR